MRIPIREQLGALVLLTTLIGLAVISIASWLVNYDRIINLSLQHLGLTASLKAAQLAANMDLMERSVRSLATRVRLQTALTLYNSGQNATASFTSFGSDLLNALAAPQEDILTLQVIVFDNKAATAGLSNSLLNVTGAMSNIELPGGAQLGDPLHGYPPNLYPNLTFVAEEVDGENLTYAYFANQKLDQDASIFLGPWQTNASFALCSITLPVINNSSNTNIVGFMTVVLDSRLIFDVLNSPIGLEETGVMLLIGPDTEDGEFAGYPYQDSLPIVTNDTNLIDAPLHFVLPPNETYTPRRHAQRAYGTSNAPFTMAQYPAVEMAATINNGQIMNAWAEISTKNEEGVGVSVGYAIPNTPLVDWVLILEESKHEVWEPIVKLRKVLIGCVFGTALGIILLVLPLAHYGSRPIRKLRDATAKSIIRMDNVPTTGSNEKNEKDSEASGTTLTPQSTHGADGAGSRWSSMFMSPFRPSPRRSPSTSRPTLKAQYPIPETVQTRRAWIQDELSDLTQYFNEMSDELVLFYGKLEERVRQRTAELETAKKAAEAANESKTLFIANISHELKTPLNGILGMCAVCMQEDDPIKIKRSLGIIYKSGDLLHNLLTDLLTFSKNQTGQIQLVESEFALRDITNQVHAIFDNQARDSRVNFSISYEGCRDALGSSDAMVEKQYGPPGTGRVKDMFLWGDMQRILQVVINLVSNSLKFTPAEGCVSLRIRVLDGEVAESVRTGRSPSRRSSAQSKSSTGKKYPRLRIMSRSDSNSSPESPPAASSDQHGQPILLETGREENRSRASVVSEQHINAPHNTHTIRFEFEVEDTGPGIAKHLQKKIFEPFVQGDLRLTKKFGGTGLGLSICQQLATLMHGSISLESTEGVGSKFTLHIPLKLVKTRRDSQSHDATPDGCSRRSSMSWEHSATNPHGQASSSAVRPLPADVNSTSTSNDHTYFETTNPSRLIGLSQPYFSSSKAPMASPSAEDTSKSSASRVRVLVAEDNKVNQEVVVRMLRLEEIFDVHVAKDGQEALDKVKEAMARGETYDLIFMDVQMPNLDGRESTREIRKQGYSGPVVALTAFADEINRKECIESGMSDFMAKPIRRPALKSVLKQYCPPPAIMEVEEEKERGSTSPGVTPGEDTKLLGGASGSEGIGSGSGGGSGKNGLLGPTQWGSRSHLVFKEGEVLDPRRAESPMISPGTPR